MTKSTTGIFCGLAAFILWGILPLFWKQLEDMSSSTIVAQRIIWSVILLIPVLIYRRNFFLALKQLRSPKKLAFSLGAGVLLSVNWLIYVWANNNDRVIEVSLGYYLLPLIYIIIGYLFLHEKVSRLQWFAIFCASIGVGLQAWGIGSIPWSSIGVAASFAIYGVAKKKANSDGIAALFQETILLVPFALIFLMWFAPSAPQAEQSKLWLDGSPLTVILIILTGLATISPLLFFAAAAKRIPLGTLGILQFVAPTGQFLTGWLYLGEPFNSIQMLAFCFIWIAVILYSIASFIALEQNPKQPH